MSTSGISTAQGKCPRRGSARPCTEGKGVWGKMKEVGTRLCRLLGPTLLTWGQHEGRKNCHMAEKGA